MDYIQQISNALDKEVENVAFLAYFPFNKLEKKLLLIRQQLSVAEKNKQTGALELLKIWEEQILEAQILKHDLKIEDNAKLEMQMYLPEIEAYEAIEKRQALLKEKLLNDKFTKAEHNQKNIF